MRLKFTIKITTKTEFKYSSLPLIFAKMVVIATMLVLHEKYIYQTRIHVNFLVYYYETIMVLKYKTFFHTII